VLPINVFLTDHKAETIKRVVSAVKRFRDENQLDGVTVRLASGSAGVQAATNEVLEETELPMMLYVYATIVILVFLTYRDWRAVVACCLPLTLATFIGYWFMKALDIGLTVATLPVMVLAVGIGVDYAFYIYNRLQIYLADGMDIVSGFRRALSETGIATVFTALTLSVGVATWLFSPLKFQADMGLLLAFMFMLNMLMAITVLPALAVTLDAVIPRRGPVRRPLMVH
jgi:predicted RND superfamily exporter protein